MITIFNQDINKEILKNVYNEFKKDTWVNGKIVNTFENNIKRILNTKQSVSSCNSGSDALMLALLLDHKKNKDIYITTPISYLASSSIPRFLKLNLIYIDVESNNYLMSLNKLENFLKSCPYKIKKRIRGVINVELFGKTCDLDRLRRISKKFKLSLIGDCAQSLGTFYKNKSTVSYYDYAITSFYPTKILSCYGDGGAVFTKKNIKKLALLKNNGHTKFDKSICKIIGINSRLDSLQAYILNKKLPRLKSILKKKKKVAKFLFNKLHKDYEMPIFEKSVNSNNYVFSFYVIPKLKKRFLKIMNKNKIECKTFYQKLLSKNELLKPIYRTNLKNAEYCCKSLVSIPSHENLTNTQLLKITKLIKSFK
ncbi:DegT/DnrJ/EryC1/StrS family aminotransferase [Pelagibacteraceae bacterium]|nr:DegT/DnrJ/EryC1/StrS family aminotransferase [Pelagibacteraceae bacterium]